MHHEELQAIYKDLRLKQAARDYAMAKYYDNRSEFGAARMYYGNVQKNYEETNLALESEDRLNHIATLPEAPKQSLQWLADLFPKEEGRAKPLFKRKTISLGK